MSDATQSYATLANEQQHQETAPHYREFRTSDPRKKSPFIAGLFSVIPGLGQIYVGYYQRGFIHVVVAGAVLSLLVAMGENQSFALMPMGVIFLIFFELYNIIDAGRRAALYNLSLDGVEQVDLPDDLSKSTLGGTFPGGVALVVFGVIALFHTAFGMSLDWVESWCRWHRSYWGSICFIKLTKRKKQLPNCLRG